MPNSDGTEMLTNAPFAKLVLGVNRTVPVAGSAIIDHEVLKLCIEERVCVSFGKKNPGRLRTKLSLSSRVLAR